MKYRNIKQFYAGRTLVQMIRASYYQMCDRLWSRPLGSLLARLRLWVHGASVGRNLCVSGRLRLHIEGKFIIGSNVLILSGPANFVGAGQRMAFWVGRYGRLTVEDRCKMSNTTIVAAESVTVKEDTYIGGGCEIYDSDFHPLGATARISGGKAVRTGPIVIGPKAFVGARTIILKNVSIGEGAVIGAGSIITKSVPAYEIWAGAPAKCIRKLTPDER